MSFECVVCGGTAFTESEFGEITCDDCGYMEVGASQLERQEVETGMAAMEHGHLKRTAKKKNPTVASGLDGTPTAEELTSSVMRALQALLLAQVDVLITNAWCPPQFKATVGALWMCCVREWKADAASPFRMFKEKGNRYRITTSEEDSYYVKWPAESPLPAKSLPAMKPPLTIAVLAVACRWLCLPVTTSDLLRWVSCGKLPFMRPAPAVLAVFAPGSKILHSAGKSFFSSAMLPSSQSVERRIRALLASLRLPLPPVNAVGVAARWTRLLGLPPAVYKNFVRMHAVLPATTVESLKLDATHNTFLSPSVFVAVLLALAVRVTSRWEEWAHTVLRPGCHDVVLAKSVPFPPPPAVPPPPPKTLSKLPLLKHRKQENALARMLQGLLPSPEDQAALCEAAASAVPRASTLHARLKAAPPLSLVGTGGDVFRKLWEHVCERAPEYASVVGGENVVAVLVDCAGAVIERWDTRRQAMVPAIAALPPDLIAAVTAPAEREPLPCDAWLHPMHCLLDSDFSLPSDPAAARAMGPSALPFYVDALGLVSHPSKRMRVAKADVAVGKVLSETLTGMVKSPKPGATTDVDVDPDDGWRAVVMHPKLWLTRGLPAVHSALVDYVANFALLPKRSVMGLMETLQDVVCALP